MSVAFFSDDSDTIKRKVYTVSQEGDKSLDINDIYEIERCTKWINSNSFSKIALQFPDSLLSDAASVASKLQEYTEKILDILGDTSYGSCCVDEVASEHISANAIIHFGHACLSSTQRLPVLYIFGKSSIDVEDATCAFKKLFPDKASLVVFIYEVVYSHAVGHIVDNLKDYENLIVSTLEIPSKDNICATENLNDNQVKVSKCHRYFSLPKSHNLNNYCIFYVGLQTQTLTNFMLSFNHCKFYSYHPLNKIAQPETLDVNKYLKKRYYYIEKTKDAKRIGILVGTLGVLNYLTIVQHLKEIIKEAGKKSYTLSVGKLNTVKLANFAAIEIFVNVACAESSVIDSREFYQPIITPYELEIALNQAREWTGDYITDFSELLPGAAKHIPPSQMKRFEADVSLITGNMRSSNLSCVIDSQSDETSALVSRDDMKISTIHSQAAGEFLSQCSWKGLEQCLGETPVIEVQQGQKGIACEYEDEGNKVNEC